MKYRKILTDNTIFDGSFTDYAMSKVTGLSASYISLLRRGMRTASEETFDKIVFGKAMILQNRELPKFTDTRNERSVLDKLLNR